MRSRFYWQLSWRNLSANKRLLLPFILSSSMMGILLYIVTNLLNSPYVKERHTQLSGFMGFGTLLIGLFMLIFMLYSSRLSRKNRRKEFALYAILGLEKRHIARILRIEHFIQYLFVLSISIVGGQLLGRLCFVLLDKLLAADMDTSVMGNYAFNSKVALIIMLFFAILFILIQLLASIQVRILTPLELMRKQDMAETEPKSKWFISILGLTLLFAGYILALTTTGTLQSLLNFFIAAIMVIFGSYFCFTSFSIVLLKTLRRSKAYYHKPSHFLSVSGMLYRMKANGMGLASICVMLTGLVISLGTVGAIYQNMENMSISTTPYAYQVQIGQFSNAQSEAETTSFMKEIKDKIASVPESPTADKIIGLLSGIAFVQDTDGKLLPHNNTQTISPQSRLIEVYYWQNYHEKSPELPALADDEVYMTANSAVLKQHTELELAGKTYRVRPLEDAVAGNIAVETYKIVLPDATAFRKVIDCYYAEPDSSPMRSPIVATLAWNAPEEGVYREAIGKLIDSLDFPVPLRVRSEFRKDLYSLNGGFVFLGVIVAVVFLIGTIIVIYYKQVSEAYEDKHKYNIMRQVGLPRSLIKKTANGQIVWMFFLPLLATMLHVLVASKVLFQLLALFGVIDWMFYVTTVGLVLLVIIAIYYLLFRITSRVYYQIVA